MFGSNGQFISRHLVACHKQTHFIHFRMCVIQGLGQIISEKVISIIRLIHFVTKQVERIIVDIKMGNHCLL